MRGVVRGGDLVGRLSGDEFIVVCPETEAVAVAQVAEKVRAAVCGAPAAISTAELPVGLSLGWASAEGRAGVAQLIQAADAALYRAKAAGRGQVAGGMADD